MPARHRMFRSMHQAALDHTTSIPGLLAFLPAGTLAAFWLGGEPALLAFALGLPLGLLLARGAGRLGRKPMVPRDSVTGLMLRDGFDAVLDQSFADTSDSALRSACLVVDVDDARELQKRHGQAVVDSVMQSTADRLIGALRTNDTVARLGDGRFAICLEPVRQLDLELCIQLSGRLQSALAEPLYADGATIFVSASIGFCLRSRAPKGSACDWLAAAILAVDEARSNGPSTIRAYSPDMQARSDTRKTLHRDVVRALDAGQICAWFQPQLCTDTGRVSGFETLARWVHPTRGTISPDQFLPALQAQGLMEKLSEIVLHGALTALRGWDLAGIHVPRVSVNLSQQDLNNPRLSEKISWALDRHEVAPERLCLEILETVVSDAPEDTVVHNINALSRLGCPIDLDDYGTGHASIAAIRRFPVSRIKIDRSFVMKSDRDPEQQRMIGALLTMAERLELETLAEGVETIGEHALLAQLGCDHVQGFGIARPMPYEDTVNWLNRHEAKLRKTPQIGRKTS